MEARVEEETPSVEVDAISEDLDEQLLMEWNEDPTTKDVPADTEQDKSFADLLNSATFVMDSGTVEPEMSRATLTPEKITPRKAGKPKEKSVDQFDCELCSRKYWRRSKLEAHLRTHHGQKEKAVTARSPEDKRSLISQCPECRVQLENKTEMFVHRLTHILPAFSMMSCPLCGDNQYSFTNPKHHVREVHEVREKWFCPICPDGRTFTQNHSLLAHISTFHFDASKTAPTQYPCDKCQKLFTSKALLGKHTQNDHGGLIEKGKKGKLVACYICQKKMDDLTQLRRHLINHKEHTFGRQSPKINKEEFSAKFLEFSRKYFKAQKPSFSISSILSKA